MAKLCPKVRPQRSVNLKFTLRPTRTCMPLEFVLVKLHLVVKKDELKNGWYDQTMYGSGGSVAKGCGKVMSNRRKKTKVY